jgi:hypothetical protein
LPEGLGKFKKKMPHRVLNLRPSELCTLVIEYTIVYQITAPHGRQSSKVHLMKQSNISETATDHMKGKIRKENRKTNHVHG